MKSIKEHTRVWHFFVIWGAWCLIAAFYGNKIGKIFFPYAVGVSALLILATGIILDRRKLKKLLLIYLCLAAIGFAFGGAFNFIKSRNVKVENYWEGDWYLLSSTKECLSVHIKKGVAFFPYCSPYFQEVIKNSENPRYYCEKFNGGESTILFEIASVNEEINGQSMPSKNKIITYKIYKPNQSEVQSIRSQQKKLTPDSEEYKWNEFNLTTYQEKGVIHKDAQVLYKKRYECLNESSL